MDCMRNDFEEGVLLDGRYRTIAPLNHGSFGMVFKARDTFTGDFVALKCLTKPSAAITCPSAISVDDRSEEQAIHRRIGHHRNIVNLLHSFETTNHTYLVLEYCTNGDLYEAIRVGRGPLETEHVREFMLELIRAVEFMHDKDIYHRDIKPENIFLSQNGSMKLGDFGLATSDSPSFEAAVGSDRYMAPEQYDPSPSGYDPAKADVWAIGICLLNVLFSRNPFATPTISDPLFADFAGDRQNLFDVFPNMSQDTFEVLMHCLALDPARRSLAKVKTALKRVVSFTTENEMFDEFCTDEVTSPVPASANREPLRTPSVTSPQVTNGAFPWAKALAMSPPQPVRRLSAIPDSEYASEDLFGTSQRSGETSEDWFSVKPDSASISSAVDSGLGVSLQSEANAVSIARSRPMRVPISGSLPAPGPNFSSIYGGKGQIFSKSWSDLYDEENDENENNDAIHHQQENQSQDHLPFPASDLQLAPAKTITALKSHELVDSSPSSGRDTPRASALQEHPNPAATNIARVRTPSRARNNADNVSVSEHTGFFFEDCNVTPTPHHAKLAVYPDSSFPTPRATPAKPSSVPTIHTPVPHHYASPPTPASPPKSGLLDKWAELGDRRRAHPVRERAKSVTSKFAELKSKREPREKESGGFTARARALSWRRATAGAEEKEEVPAVPRTPGWIEREQAKEWAISRDWRKHTPVSETAVFEDHIGNDNDSADHHGKAEATTSGGPGDSVSPPSNSTGSSFFNFGVKRNFGSSLASGFGGLTSWARNSGSAVKEGDLQPPPISPLKSPLFHFDADHQHPGTSTADGSGASTPRLSASSSGWVCRDESSRATALQSSSALHCAVQAEAVHAVGSAATTSTPRRSLGRSRLQEPWGRLRVLHL